MTEKTKPRRQRLIAGIIASLAILGLLVVVLDWRQVHKILGEADWRLVPVALLFTAISYTCLSINFATESRIFGIRMRRRDLSAIGFVSTNLNYLLSSAGVAGYSVRFLLMREGGATLRDIVAVSLFDTYLSSLALLALLPIGLIHLLTSHPLSKGAIVALGLAAVLLVVLLLLASAVVFVRTLRGRVLRFLGKAALRLIHRDLKATLDEFDASMSQGVSALRTRPLLFALLIVLVVADWAASIAALWFCFDALGEPIPLGVLLTGFSLGIAAGALSMVPGGLGVQEGSMAGVYALLGVSLHKAVLASILFRVVYYLIPYLVSLGFYGWLLKRLGRAKPGSSAAGET